ncbi:MAG: methionine--tRNA ligase subunit beta, partial [Lysobacter sp.]
LAPIADAYARNEAATALRLTMALADEANRYIDEHKPWVLAKQDGGGAELHAVCTQGLNLFRVLNAALKPVLPRVSAQAEAFLASPVSRWSDLDAPLLAHRIAAYTPLFTRIDPKQIDAMTEASKDSLKPADTAIALVPQGDFLRDVGAALAAKPDAAKGGKKLTAEAAPTKEVTTGGEHAGAATIGIDDFARLDLRVGRVIACEFVEGSDKLLRFELDAGDLGTRQIFSGIRASYGEPQTLVGRNVVFIANLAPRKMRFGLSEGMILSAGFDGGSLHLLDADNGVQPGMPVR